jgi:hypothetical protein
MRVSGFSFVRNAVDLAYPVVEAITSILPVCDEFVIAAGDSSDGTTELLRSIDSPKIRIIETTWDPALFVRGEIFAQQTDVALAACTGDWAFYIQGDEVVHERYLPLIEARMRRHIGDPLVEGLLFDYVHFFGDYAHVQTSHSWYGREIRVVRTKIGVSSWHDAQGFRIERRKLRVAHSDGAIYHYGWVRPPDPMRRKARAFRSAYGERDEPPPPSSPEPYRYGRMWGVRRFEGTHPEVMRARIDGHRWTATPSEPVGHKHDRVRVQMLTYLENYVLKRRIGERRNYILLPGLDSQRKRRLPPVGP